MYLNKAREHLATRDKKILYKKREKYEERTLRKAGVADDFDDVPVGFEHLPVVQDVKRKDEDTCVCNANYLGSFLLKGYEDKDLREEAKEKMIDLKHAKKKSNPVLLVISTNGILMTDKAGKKVFMNHKLHRISYASGNPENLQFCFMAREASELKQYCHAFSTQTYACSEKLHKTFERVFRKAFIKQQKTRRISSIVAEHVKKNLEKFKKLYDERKADDDNCSSSGGEGVSHHRVQPFRTISGIINPCSLPSYFPSMTQEEAEEILSQEDYGAFILRDSSRFSGSFSLTIKVPDSEGDGRVANYLIVRTDHGVQLRNSKKNFKSVNALIKHLTKEQDNLPCKLHLPSSANSHLAGFNAVH